MAELAQARVSRLRHAALLYASVIGVREVCKAAACPGDRARILVRPAGP